MSSFTNPFQAAADASGQTWSAPASDSLVSIADSADPEIVKPALALESWTPAFAASLLSGWLPRDETHALQLAYGTPRTESSSRGQMGGDAKVLACLERLCASTAQSIPRIPSLVPGHGDRLEAVRVIAWAVQQAEEGLAPPPPSILAAFASRRAQNLDALSLQLDEARNKISELEATDRAFNAKSANTAFTVTLGLAVAIAGHGHQSPEVVAQNIRDLLKKADRTGLSDFLVNALNQGGSKTDGELESLLKRGESLFSLKSNLRQKLKKEKAERRRV